MNVEQPPSARPIVFGEVLFDCFAHGTAVLGGAPFNVAWNLQAFGQAPLFISRIGKDALGTRIVDAMHGWEMDVTGLQFDSEHPTGRVNVRFEDDEPNYEIVEDAAWDFVQDARPDTLGNASVLYHGTLAMRGEDNRQALNGLRTKLDVARFVDVNLRAPWWQPATVLELIDGAQWVKLNEHELALIAAQALGVEAADNADAAERLLRRCGLKTLILTRGHRGAELITSDARFCVAPERVHRLVDTVGAGDAFASVMLLGLLRRWPVETSLQRAQAFASAVVGIRGATVNDAEFYAPFARAWDLG